MKEVSLVFDGYWREVNKASIPEKTGIYCVYTCKYNSVEKTVSQLNLIYIGSSENVNNRVCTHDRLSEWEDYLKKGETLCYSYAQTEKKDMVHIEAALIFCHKPRFNDEYTKSYPYEDMKISISGKASGLQKLVQVSSEK